MSILSSMWSRNKAILNPIAKALTAKIPIVGDTISSRIMMSPDQDQAKLAAATSQAVASVQTAAQPILNAPSSLPAPPPLFGTGNAGTGMSQQTMLLLAGGSIVD